MKIGCCIDLSYYDILVEKGYDSIALAAKDVAAWDEEALQKAKTKLNAGPLLHRSLNSFCTPELRLNGEGYSQNAVAAYVDKLAGRAASLGFSMIGIGAPGSRNVGTGEDRRKAYDQTKEAISLICDIASGYAIDILMESVCSLECNFITTTREALAFIEKVDKPNLHLVYDIYHEYMEHQPIEVIGEAGAEIRVVHIAQDDCNQRAYLDDEHCREYQAYWDALQAIGYHGEWNLECFVGDPERELGKSMEIMKAIQKGSLGT